MTPIAEGFVTPGDMILDPDGALYVTDPGRGEVLRIDCSGGGACSPPEPFAAGVFERPGLIEIDRGGTIWITDPSRLAIYGLDQAGEVLRVIDSM